MFKDTENFAIFGALKNFEGRKCLILEMMAHW
jgi:hypothetical protein